MAEAAHAILDIILHVLGAVCQLLLTIHEPEQAVQSDPRLPLHEHAADFWR